MILRFTNENPQGGWANIKICPAEATLELIKETTKWMENG